MISGMRSRTSFPSVSIRTMVPRLGSEHRWQFLRGQPRSSDSSGGRLDAGSLQRLGSRVYRGPRLGDERRAERVLAGDQVLVAWAGRV